MKRKTKKNLKMYACGALSGVVLMTGTTHYLKKYEKNKKEEFIDQFPKPKYEQSFADTKEVEQYTFDYYDDKITVQGDNLEIYTFDKDGKLQVKHGEKQEVPIENNEYLLKEYISEREAVVFRYLKVKDKIKDQFTVYLLFEEFAKLYEEYLNRPSFDTLENRKEIIYKTSYDYVISDVGYTIGGYKFQELEKTIQKDILNLYKKISYMREYDEVKEESKISKFMDQQQKAFKYILFKKGRE